MIISRGAKLHVCLRCQRAFAKKNLSSVVQIAHLSNIAFDEKNLDQKPLSRDSSDNTQNISECWGEKKCRRQSHHAIFGRGRSKSKKIEFLDVDQEKMIALRDDETFRPRPEPKEAPPEDVLPIDILDQLSQEIGLVSDDQVRENIDQLRPKSTQLETWNRFNRLVDQLVEGFTSPQLERYIANFNSTSLQHEQYKAHFNAELPQGSPSKPVTKNKENIYMANGSPIASITPWRPGLSPIQGYFDDDPEIGYILESRTGKQNIAVSLIRNCWKVELSEVLDGIGQFEIQIHGGVLELLFSGNPSYLQKFYHDVLTREDERLEVFRSRNVLRITSADSRKLWIVQEFNKLIQRLHVDEVSLGDLMPDSGGKKRPKAVLDAWAREIFNNRTLAELKHLTGVAIARKAQGKITITSFQKESGEQKSLYNAARRLLLTARPYLKFQKRSLESTDISTAKPLNYYQLDSLNWWSRIRPWFRLATPILKESHLPQKGSLPQSSPIVSLDTFSEGRQNTIIPEPSSELTVPCKANSEFIWSPNYSTATFATLGAVIHQYPEDKLDNMSIPDFNFNPKALISEFSTHVPNVSRLLGFAKYEEPPRSGEEVVLKFLPNPFFRLKMKAGKTKTISAAVLSTAPPVEMVFRYTPRRALKYSHTRAIVRDSRIDIMLPQEVVDIQVRQITSSIISKKKKINSIKKFVSSCKLNLQPGGNIYIPPSIVLPISSYLFTDQGVIFKGNTKASQSQKESKHTTQTAEYLFAGLETRKRLIYEYDSWLLNYTYIDAGKSGGRRGELSLRPIKNKEGTGEQEFLDFSLELACRLTSLCTPEMARFRQISKIVSSPVRRYCPVHDPASKYPRSFLYIPKRILDLNDKDKDNLDEDILPDFKQFNDEEEFNVPEVLDDEDDEDDVDLRI